jgi:predicted MFS family arabinose efflux permease
MSQFTIAWLILDLTGSVGQLGIAVFLQGVGWTVVALFGGLLADRYSRRKFLVAIELFNVANALVIASLVLSGAVSTWYVFLASLLLGVLAGVAGPARQALIRYLVGDADILNAVSLSSLQMQAAKFLWPALGGVIIGGFGTGFAFCFVAICSVVGCVLLTTIQGLREETTQAANPLAQIFSGIRYSFSTPTMRTIMALNYTFAFSGLVFLNLAAGFAREEQGFSASATGLFIMATGLGACSAGILLSVHEVRERISIFTLGCAAFGVIMLLMCLNRSAAGAYALMAGIGFTNSGFVIIAQTIFQVSVDARYLGRVMSLWMLAGGIAAVSALPLGMAADAFGMRWVFGVLAAGFVLVSCVVASTLLQQARRSGSHEQYRAESSSAG